MADRELLSFQEIGVRSDVFELVMFAEIRQKITDKLHFLLRRKIHCREKFEFRRVRPVEKIERMKQKRRRKFVQQTETQRRFEIGFRGKFRKSRQI